MLGLQAAGAAPLVLGRPVDHPRPSPPPSASATPPPGTAQPAPRESGGGIDAVTDEEILDAYRLLAAPRGCSASRPRPRRWPGCCRRPAGAGGGRTVVCTLTGHGLKDPDRAITQVDITEAVDASATAVTAALGL